MKMNNEINVREREREREREIINGERLDWNQNRERRQNK
jgi:hypothetical protein